MTITHELDRHLLAHIETELDLGQVVRALQRFTPTSASPPLVAASTTATMVPARRART